MDQPKASQVKTFSLTGSVQLLEDNDDDDLVDKDDVEDKEEKKKKDYCYQVW